MHNSRVVQRRAVERSSVRRCVWPCLNLCLALHSLGLKGSRCLATGFRQTL